MSGTSSVGYATFAFKKREPRFVLTRVAIAYTVAMLVFSAIFIAATWSVWGELISWYMQFLRDASTGAQPEMPDARVFAAVAPWWGLSALVGLVLFAAFEAACLRWLARGERGGGLFGLRFDADTLRVFGIYWVWIGLLLAFTVLVAIVYVALRFLGGVHPIAQFVSLLLAALMPLGLAGLLLWFAVRFAPAAALSVREKRFAFFSAPKTTQGRYWPLLGGFVLAMVAYVAVSLIVQQVLSLPFNTALQGAAADMVRGASPEETMRVMARTFFSPGFIALAAAYWIVSQAMACVFYVAWFGVNARAVLDDDAPAPATAEIVS